MLVSDRVSVCARLFRNSTNGRPTHQDVMRNLKPRAALADLRKLAQGSPDTYTDIYLMDRQFDSAEWL